RMVPEREQRRDIAVGAQDGVPALAAVAAVGPAAGDVGLATERHGASASVTTPQVDLRFVDELAHDARIRTAGSARPGKGTCGRGRGVPAPENEFCWLEHVRKHVRPESQTTSTSLRPLRCPKRTTPSVVANSVSSLPRRTLSPGWNLVPR